MTYPTLPVEVPYTDIERDMIENEPPGMFPEDQNSYWGQVRKLFADYLQANALDLFTAWYNNLDPRNVDANDISEWEDRVGVPGDRSAITLAARRGFVQNRLRMGAFSRSLVNDIIETFLNAVLIVASGSTTFGSGGILLGSGGATLFSGVTGDPKTMYRVYFDYMNRVYYVRILNTLGEDLSGLTRELQRITPAGWTLNISDVANPLVYSRMVLNDAPLQWYALDGNANDSSGYTAFPGTQNGGVTFGQATLVNAAVGGVSAALFDGVNDYVSVPDAAASWPFAQMTSVGLTVESWIKLAAAPGAGAFGTIWSKGSYLFGVDENRKLVVVPPAGATLRSTTALTIGTVYHVALVINGSTLTLYVNGIAEATGTHTPGSLATATNIGRYVTGTNGFLNATLDEVAVYDRILSAATILSHYKTGTNVA